MSILSAVTKINEDYALENISNKLLSGLYNQRRTGKFCDVKIRMGETCLWTHSCVLSTFSAKLHNVFVTRSDKQGKGKKSKAKIYNNWSLNNPIELTLSNLKENDEVHLTECIECVDKVIDFLYHGKINIPNNDHLEHVENLSKLFNLSDLSIVCRHARLNKTKETEDIDVIVDKPSQVEEVEAIVENVKPFKQNSGRYTCLGCGDHHRTASALLKHLRDQANDNHSLRCSLCLKYQAPDVTAFLSHIELHDHALPFFCLACEARFRTRTALSSHEPRHSTETPFLCSECGRGFKWKHALTSHALVHSEEKRHLCDTCGFSTAHISTFRTHKMVHAGACFRCPEPNCTFVASRKQSLAHHIATHSKERHYQCEVCGQSFSMYKNLRRHAARHEPSPAGLMCCPVPGCLYSNTRLDKIKAHAERHRLGKPVRSTLVPRVRRTTPVPPAVANSILPNPDNMNNETVIGASEFAAEENIVIILPPVPEGTLYTLL